MEPEIRQTEPVLPVPETPKPNKVLWGGWATIGLGAAIIAIYVVVQSLVTIVFLVGELITNPDLTDLQSIMKLASNGDLITIATIVSAFVGIGFIILFIKVRKGASLRNYLELRSISKKAALILFAILIGLVVLSSGLDLIWQAPQNTMFMVDAYKTATWPVLLWIAVAVFAPVFEEGFFRGFLFVGLKRTRLGVVGTIILTSLIWTLLHIQYNVYGVVTIFILGIIFGYIRHKTGSLWSTIFLHALWNVVAMIGTILYINGIV